jgi:hypothetical protein
MIKEIYYLPMVLGRDDHKKNNFDRPGIPYSECLKMFPRSFTKILASDEILLSKMEERLKLYDKEDYYFAMIGDIFIQFAEFFKKYSEYMIEYEACTTVFRKHRESSLRFQHWLSRRRRICDFDIMSLLVMPVQRTTRHKMLLEKLLAATDVSHGEYDILVDAVECMKELAEYQNECIRTVSNVKQIEELAILLKIDNLVDSERRFLIQGPAYLEDVEHRVYLFSDSIFFQNKKVTHCILKRMCISGGSKYSILLTHDDLGDMELFFDTYEEKKQWLSLLEVAIRNSRKSWKIPTFVYQHVTFVDFVGKVVKWCTVSSAIQEQMAVAPGALSITL